MLYEDSDDKIEREEEYVETDFIVHKIDHDSQSLIFGLYSKLNAYEQHFHTLQSKYRSIATTLLFAVFAAIGFFFITHIDLPISIWMASSMVCVGGIIAMIALWQQDLIIFQNLSEAVLVEEVRMERKYEWLPKARTNILNLRVKTKSILFQGSLYIGYCSILMFLIIGFTILDQQGKNWTQISLIILGISLVSVGILHLMGKKTRQIHQLWELFEKSLSKAKLAKAKKH